MKLDDAIKKIKDVINAGVKPAPDSFEDALCTVVDSVENSFELPEVTDADDGKVLTVDDGKWVVATPSGGDSIGTLYVLDMEPLTTDSAIPEGAENVVNNAYPVALTADAVAPMDYAALVSFLSSYDVVRVDMGYGQTAIEITRVIMDDPVQGQSGYSLTAGSVIVPFMEQYTLVGVAFAWTTK